MRNRLLFTLLFLLSLLAVPAHAQGDTRTIYDIIAGDADYRLLYEALEADGGLVDVLRDESATLTLFAPDNRGVRATLDALGVPFEALLADADLLDAVLRHHITPAILSYGALVRQDTVYVMTALEERGLLIQTVDDAVFLNSVPVLDRGTRAANGYVHRVEQLLIPPERLFQPDEAPPVADDTIFDYVVGRYAAPDSFELLLAEAERIAHLLADPAMPYTLFMPSPAAIERFLDDSGLTLDDLTADEEALSRLLADHILPGHIVAGTVETVIPLLGGIPFRVLSLSWAARDIHHDGDGWTIDGIAVIESDILLSNGVVHIIDAVIAVPVSAEAALSAR
ncbi:MAG: fasciclin domain-containing protein [Anaerolineaceae bacterium]|nr:MAG: fasciclin domain-containing protein [Anaerolineaceae bacterium]